MYVYISLGAKNVLTRSNSLWMVQGVQSDPRTTRRILTRDDGEIGTRRSFGAVGARARVHINAGYIVRETTHSFHKPTSTAQRPPRSSQKTDSDPSI